MSETTRTIVTASSPQWPGRLRLFKMKASSPQWPGRLRLFKMKAASPQWPGRLYLFKIMIRYPDRYPTFIIPHQRQHLLYKVLEPAVPSTPDLLAPVTSPHPRHLLQPTYHNSCIQSTGHCVITRMPSFMLSHRLYTSPMMSRSLHLHVLSALRCAPLDWFRECRGAGSRPPRP